MTGHLTMKQHFVPNFYLKGWTNSDSKLFRWDLKHSKWESRTPKATFTEPNFYEEDPHVPDNRVEKLLGAMESDCAPVLKSLNEIASKGLPSALTLLQALCNSEPAIEEALKRFIAFQYLRVPGAIERKRGEIEGLGISDDDKELFLNPGRFVESGYAYLAPKFATLKVLILFSQNKSFLTSDWPCFDMKDADDAPILGEEIGTNPNVVAKMPIGPKLVAILYHREKFSEVVAVPIPSVLVVHCPAQEVANINALMVQQAARFVISDDAVAYVSELAKTRRKPPK